MSITNLSFTSSSGETQLYYTLDSAESFTISSDSTSWLTVSVSNGVITVNVTNNESESDRTGHLTPKVGSETCSSKAITVLQGGSSPTPPAGSFEELISNFNAILNDFGFNQITSNMDVYSYLYEGYMAASNEYNSANSPYFTQSTYEEVFKDGRSQWGSNNEYEQDGTAKNAMLCWLMAMQLAEIVHTEATWVKVNGYDSYEVNVQTMFFKRAYDLFGNDDDGMKIPLYNNYTLKGDPMVARLAASAIYSTVRANHDFEDFDDYMDELNSSNISDSNTNSMLGYLELDTVGGIAYPSAYNSACTSSDDSTRVDYYLSFPGEIGYNVNYNYVLPPAPGPYVTANGMDTNYMTSAQKTAFANRQDVCTNGKRHVRGRAYDLTNDGTFKDQFYSSGQSDHYKNYNYRFDVAVDKYVCDNYNLVTGSNLSRTVQACADDNDDTEYLYLSNVYYKYATYGNCVYNGFYLGSSSDNNGNFSGPFSSGVLGRDLSSEIKTGNTYSSLGKLLVFTHGVSNHTRDILLLHQYGRMRPGAANDSGTDRQPRSTSEYNLNFLSDNTISALAGGVTRYTNGTSPERWYVDKNYNLMQDASEKGALEYYNGINVSVSPSCFNGAPGMRAHTYPSGHNAGVWAETMLMMELFPSRAQYIYKAGYSYGVSRTILRAHWHSDTIYGRFIAMMSVPLTHSVTEVNGYLKDNSTLMIDNVCSYNFRELFTCAKTEIAGGTCSVQDGCGSSGDITFTLKIYNDLSVPVKLNGEMYMYMGDEDASTGKHCNEGGIALDGDCEHGVQGNHISIPAGGNQSFSVTIPAATVALRGNVVSNYRADNVIFYSYGELLDSTSQYYKGEISRAFYAYPMDSTTATGSRITLVNGSTHFVHIPPNVTVTDLGQTIQYNQISHYKNSSSQLTSAGDKYLW